MEMRAEVIAVAFPAQGHVNPMLHLCHILASNGLSLTFCTPLYFHNNLMANSLAQQTHPNISFQGVSLNKEETEEEEESEEEEKEEELREEEEEEESEEEEKEEEEEGEKGVIIKEKEKKKTKKKISEAEEWFLSLDNIYYGLASLVQSLLRKNGNVLPSCIISDALFSVPAQKVACRFGFPSVSLITVAQTFGLVYLSRVPLPISTKDKLKDDNSLVQLVPGVPPVRTSDLPAMYFNDDRTKVTNAFCRRQFGFLQQSERVLVNSFWELEEDAIRAIPNVHPIGPLISLNSNNESNQNVSHKRKSLWLEDESCMKWLNGQPDNSVVYLSFGSVVILSKLQMKELSIGLEESGHRLLIVFRPNMLFDAPDASANEFFATTLANQVSFIVQWAPQLQVLSHPSIGLFITHCGWNSILESISNGVPMLCWPAFFDQAINARFVVDTWKIGMSLKNKESDFVSRVQVTTMITCIMGDNEGCDIRRRVKNLKKAAQNNMMEGGTSWKNVQSLIKMINQHHNIRMVEE